MKTPAALGVVGGGFLLSPPPKSVVVALLWLGARAHPAVTLAAVMAGLEDLVARSDGDKITPQTQKRILSQVSQFLDWCVYRGDLMDNPFKALRIDQRVKVASYVAPTDDEVRRLERRLIIDASEPWLDDILRNHSQEARQRVSSLLQDTTETAEGCLVTPGPSRRKVRFRGGQTRAYRFIYAVLNNEVLTIEDVVRHWCHNALCINPDHLEVGTRAENKHNDWEVAGYGIDFTMLQRGKALRRGKFPTSVLPTRRWPRPP